jgi:hypothetical protein
MEKIPRNEAINKINKEKDDETTTNKSPTTPKTSVPTTSNDVVKIKRKRDEVRQTSDSSFIYTEEPSVNTSSVHNSDDDVETDNDDQVYVSTVANDTITDVCAFDHDVAAPTETNN